MQNRVPESGRRTSWRGRDSECAELDGLVSAIRRSESRSLLGRLERLPTPRRQAAEIVFGLISGTASDRFQVGLGVLSLLSEVADVRPLLCVVDDAQRLDQASALRLAFVARRLPAAPSRS